MFTPYVIEITDSTFEGIISISLTNKLTNFSISIIACYLPPEQSVWGKDSDHFFVHLCTVYYLNIESDIILITGDFNARIGNNNDIITDIDGVRDRFILDYVKGGHAEAFLDFLKDTKLCILNGRFGSDNDNYTYISTRGKSIVDYMIVPHDNMSYIKKLS